MDIIPELVARIEVLEERVNKLDPATAAESAAAADVESADAAPATGTTAGTTAS